MTVHKHSFAKKILKAERYWSDPKYIICNLHVQGFPEGNKMFYDHIDFIRFFTSVFKHHFFR